MLQNSDVPDFPILRECPMHPPAIYSDFQQKDEPSRVRMWNGKIAWVFTRYDDVKFILMDSRFSIVPTRENFPNVSSARAAIRAKDTTFISMDAPGHTRYRKMLAKEFTVKKMEAWRPRIAEIAGRLLDEMIARGGPVDLVHDFCLPLPSLIISELLGVPYESHEFFQEQSKYRVRMDISPDTALAASRRMLEFLDSVTRSKEALDDPGDDIIGRLITEQLHTGELSREELVAMADLMVVAGHETTANMIALGVLSLMLHPNQRDMIRNDRSRIGPAIEEMLRYHTIAHFNGSRVALEDIEIRGHKISKGDGILALANAANRDPSVFQCPNDFDITRDSSAHIAFSFGVHQCLGQNLARIEMQEALLALFERLPDIRLVGSVDELPFKGNVFVYGLHKLPVQWG